MPSVICVELLLTGFSCGCAIVTDKAVLGGQMRHPMERQRAVLWRIKLPSSLIVRLPKSATSLLPQYRKRFAIRGLPWGEGP